MRGLCLLKWRKLLAHQLQDFSNACQYLHMDAAADYAADRIGIDRAVIPMYWFSQLMSMLLMSDIRCIRRSFSSFFAFIDLEALFVLSNKLYKLLLCNFMHLFWRLVQIKIIYCSIKHTIILQTQSFQPESPDPILRNCGKQKGTIFSHHPNVVSGVTRNTATSTTATIAQIIWNLDIKDEKKSPECSI